METWLHRNDDNNILLIAGFGGASSDPRGTGRSDELAGLAASRRCLPPTATAPAALSGSAQACRQRQIPGPPPWNSHGSLFFFGLHVTRNRRCSSQRTLDRHGLISPDGAPGKHANHTAPPAPRYRPPPSVIRPEDAYASLMSRLSIGLLLFLK